MIHRGLALKKRFGDHISLGELTAAWIAHRALLLNEPLTISELAERSKIIKATDPSALESMLVYVDEIAEMDRATLAEYHQLWNETRNEVGDDVA